MTRFLVCLAVVGMAGCGSTQVRDAIPRAARAPFQRAAVPAGHYRVQAGDTLYKIAFELGVDYRDLAHWNRMADPDLIRAGEVLRVTPPRLPVRTPTQPAEPAPSTRTAAAGPAFMPDAGENPPDIWVWPCRGALLARYGEGISKGIDIGGVRGQPVQAAAPGRVVYAGSGLRGYGKLIIIRHGKSLLSAYAHNARLLVTEGNTVTRGQTIAEMGDSDTDRIKLHFEIREFGKPVDPLNYLPKLS